MPAPSPNRRHRYLRGLPLAAYFCLLALIVFATQFAGSGFGNRAHHSWITSQILAIVSRATPVNGFVGHSRSVMDADGALDHEYFARSPVVFDALTGTLFNLTDNLTLKVWLARQVMHAIFILTMLLAWRLLRRLGAQPVPALVMVTLGFSGQMLLYYREMFDYEHASLLGMLLLLTAIVEEKHARRRRRLTLVTLLALSLGRGYASLAVLGLWFVLEATGILLRRGLTPTQRLRATLGHPATRLLLLAMVWILLLLSWNVAHEMLRRDVPFADSGIVGSILERAPGGQNARALPPLADLASILERRFVLWFFPLDEAGDRRIQQLALPLALALVAVFCARQRPERRVLLLLTAFSGALWIFVMINHTWHHDFTTMYALGFALVFWLALLERVRHPLALHTLLLLALALFLRNSLEVERRNSDHFRDTAVYTEDFSRILHRIDRGQVIYAAHNLQDKVINRGRYTLGFYLGDNILTETAGHADYIVSTRAVLALPATLFDDGPDGWRLYRTLTPENRVAFLFDSTYADYFPPEQIGPAYNFGAELALGHWALRDEVQVRPCQRINVESWWQAIRPLAADYSLQLALVNLAGEALGANAERLTTVDTSDWETNAWFPDLRPLTIPCDAPAGEYPLVLTVYDPLRLAEQGPLPLINADGSAGDTWLYLTTLFVNRS